MEKNKTFRLEKINVAVMMVYNEKNREDLKTQSSEPPEDCAICLDSHKTVCKTSCGHYYCPLCIATWMEVQDKSTRRKRCPTCRQVMRVGVTPKLRCTMTALVPLTLDTWRRRIDDIITEIAEEVLSLLKPYRKHIDCYSMLVLNCDLNPPWMPKTRWDRKLSKIVEQLIRDQYDKGARNTIDKNEQESPCKKNE